MSKSRATKKDDTMTELNTVDPLADLGLDGGAAVTDTGTEPTTETTEVPRAKPTTPETEFEVGEITVGEVTELPGAARGERQQRYPFNQLVAPKDGKISTFTVPFKGGDEAKFKRSVQSATTSANRNEEGRYYESRTVSKDGKLVGIAVYRTDARPAGK